MSSLPAQAQPPADPELARSTDKPAAVAPPSAAVPADAALTDSVPTVDGLPGLFRVPTPMPSHFRLFGAAHAGYGFTEAQAGDAGSHHRILANAAVGAAFLKYLQASVMTELRHDRHPEDALGEDDGTVIDTVATVRGAVELAPRFNLGADIAVGFPGATSSSFATPQPQARVLGNMRLESGLLLAGHAGFRLGASGAVIDESANMRPGDRIALGLSEFGAVLLGVGASQRFGRAALLGEVSWDLLVGDGAPDAFSAPIRGTLGGRYHLSDALAIQLIVDASLGDRPAANPGDPLVPIEPRVRGLFGVTYVLEPSRAAPVFRPVEPEQKPSPENEPPEEAVAPAEVEPAAPEPAHLTVEVVDHTGHPISDAQVMVQVRGQEGSDGSEERHQLELFERNVYEVKELPAGEAEITVSAELLKNHHETVLLAPGEKKTVSIQLEPAATSGSILRGLVRSYSGEGLQATITIEPLGREVMSGEEGVFELEVPPGTYTVIIDKEGYRSQRRRLRVTEEGVTVLNADLQSTGN